MKFKATNKSQRARVTSGILYTQRDGFVDFEVPVPLRQREETYEDRTQRLGWTPFALTTWLTHDAGYPVVTLSSAIEAHPTLEIWFRSRADFVHFCYEYEAPQRDLQYIKYELERIHHGQHATADNSECSRCDESEMYSEATDIQQN